MADTLSFYYFSGTGNSKHVAKWFTDVALDRGMVVETIDISNVDRKKIVPPPSGSLVGFCSPTHGFNYPPVMLWFLFRFPRARNNAAVLMNTRAGFKIGRIYMPGLSGMVFILAWLVLWLKGYKIRGTRSVDLPTNWISIHPAMRKKDVGSLFLRCEKITRTFANKIIDGKRCYYSLRELPIDLLIAPVAVLYDIIGRFIFAKSFYASNSCTNCGLCIRQCPVQAIRLVDNRPFWSYRCESCMRCMNACPERAVETAHGYLIGVLVLLNVFAQTLFYNWLVNQTVMTWAGDGVLGSLLSFLLETGIVFLSLIVSYWLFHFLRKIRLIEWINNYTSLTFYNFWGRYKSGLK
ncbi:MAG TPA: EFR1 family ferrodoxin [Prolixibacteraceae bacterium]|nr:EFR1 family ferrodoxin [Prolixibacteraceae bacterium]